MAASKVHGYTTLKNYLRLLIIYNSLLFYHFDKVHARISFLNVCSYHVTYAFLSESTLSSCLNIMELSA